MGAPFRTLPSSRRPRRRFNPWALLGAALLVGAIAALAFASCQGDDESSDTTLPALTSTSSSTTVSATTTTLAQFYEVQQGDTLFAIAEQFGVDLNELITVNSIANPDDIKAGQKLQIPPPTVLVTTPGSTSSTSAAATTTGP